MLAALEHTKSKRVYEFFASFSVFTEFELVEAGDEASEFNEGNSAGVV